MTKITEYNKEIKNLVTKKSKLTGENSSAGSYLKQLYNQRTALEEELNSGAESTFPYFLQKKHFSGNNISNSIINCLSKLFPILQFR